MIVAHLLTLLMGDDALHTWSAPLWFTTLSVQGLLTSLYINFAGKMVQKSLHCFNMLWTDCLLINGCKFVVYPRKTSQILKAERVFEA